MLACIPTTGNAGREETVFGHFGAAPYFTLYNSTTDELSVIENRNAHHAHGTCHPMNHLAKYKIDCVVCTGMGMRAIEALNSEGIKIYDSESKKVSEVIEKIKAGTLAEMDATRACRGHGQHDALVHQALGQGNSGRGAGFGCGRNRGK